MVEISRIGELDDLCNNQTQPVKLRKLTASESIQVAADGSLTQEQLIHQVDHDLSEPEN